MPDSAQAPGVAARDQRRRLTSRRITTRARVLTLERGLDGFTMDQLAAACGVSRRTVFNYFPGKLDAVLGAVPEPGPGARATFVAGGPHGRVLDDLGALGRAALETAVPDRDAPVPGRRVLAADPRLLPAVRSRFERLTAGFELLVLDREGPAFGAARARLLGRLLLAVLDAALDACLASTPERPLVECYDAALADARSLFA